METIRETLRVSLGVSDAAVALGIGRATLYELLKARSAPPSYMVGRRRLFPISGLEKWAHDRVTAKGNGEGDDE